ncbi:MAG: hypothetical protein HUU48_03170 [Flavobacteriales bacterium]|nr:hypothetical protein [Flavobacteriales bacterium]
MKKILVLVLASLFLGFLPACKKSSVKKQLVGEWTVTEIAVNDQPIELTEVTNSDSLDITSIREMNFYHCEKVEKDKKCAGYMTGVLNKYDDQLKNKVVSGILFQFEYEILKKDKIKFIVNYGAQDFFGIKSNLYSKLTSEFEATIKESSKSKFIFEFLEGEKTIKISLEKKENK